MIIVKRISGLIVGGFIGCIMAIIFKLIATGHLSISFSENQQLLMIGAIFGAIIGFVFYRLAWRLGEFLLDLF